MSLLNRDLIYSLIAFHDALHSTMSLLNRQVAITSFWIQVSLHSTMSLLNPVFRAFSADSAAAFTFHNVSIKSNKNLQFCSMLNPLHSTMSLLNPESEKTAQASETALHSTMSLLNRISSSCDCHPTTSFTFHNVSIKSRT